MFDELSVYNPPDWTKNLEKEMYCMKIEYLLVNSFISLIHTFVNIPALIRKRNVFLSRRAGIFTKV
jgi:hypothetical protein